MQAFCRPGPALQSGRTSPSVSAKPFITLLPSPGKPRACHGRSRADQGFADGVRLGDIAVWPSPGVIVQGGAGSNKYPIVITDEMRQVMDTTRRQGLQKDLRTLAANIRADAEGRYDSAEPGWRAEVEWTLLGIENTAGQLTGGRS